MYRIWARPLASTDRMRRSACAVIIFRIGYEVYFKQGLPCTYKIADTHPAASALFGLLMDAEHPGWLFACAALCQAL